MGVVNDGDANEETTMALTNKLLAKVEALKASHVEWLLAGGDATDADYEVYRWWTTLESYLESRLSR
jgi:hypothetical protein